MSSWMAGDRDQRDGVVVDTEAGTAEAPGVVSQLLSSGSLLRDSRKVRDQGEEAAIAQTFAGPGPKFRAPGRAGRTSSASQCRLERSPRVREPGRPGFQQPR